MTAQDFLPTMGWPALVTGPVFLCFELQGVPGFKARHRSRIVYPRNGKPFIHNYPDPTTAAYEKMMAEYAGLLMRGRPPTERPVAVLVHAFKPVPESWTKTEKERALAGHIRPTSRPDSDNYLKCGLDGMNGIVFCDDSQVIDARVIKQYSDRPALRIEVREFIEP